MLLSPVVPCGTGAATPPGGEAASCPPRPSRSERRAATRSLLRERRESTARVRRALGIIRRLSDGDVGPGEREALEAELAGIPESGQLLGGDAALWRAWWAVRIVAEEMRCIGSLREVCFARPESDLARDRDLPLHELLLLLMCMGGGCLDEELWDALWPRGRVPTPSALVQRRELLTEDGCMYLCRRVTEECLAMTGPTEPIHGIARVLAVDGTDAGVCPDPEREETRVGGKGSRKGWNQYHLNCVYDVGAESLVAARLQPKRRTHETRATCEMIAAMAFDARTLPAGDRGYGSLNLVETVRRKENLDCLLRVKDNWIKEVARLPMEELDVDVTVHVVTTQRKCDKERVARGEAKYLSGASKFGKYKASQVWDFESEVDVTFRVVRVRLGNGELETLVTTLPREAYPPEVLLELYHLRWRIENSYRVLKWQNHLAQMHCRRDDLARQEVWCRIAMHNVVSAVVACAERLHPHEDGGCPTVPDRHRASFCCATFLLNPGACPACVTERIARGRTPLRPSRTWSRRQKRAIGFAALFCR